MGLLEMNIIMSEKKNVLVGINNRLDSADEKISEPENKLSETQEKKI